MDTQVWLWWMLGSERLGKTIYELIVDPGTITYFSVVSAWEIAIKHSIGRLTLPTSSATYIPVRVEGSDFRIIDVRLEHALAVADLPRHHEDPFDRLLIAQAIVEGYQFLTADRRLAMYDVDVIHV